MIFTYMLRDFADLQLLNNCIIEDENGGEHARYVYYLHNIIIKMITLRCIIQQLYHNIVIIYIILRDMMWLARTMYSFDYESYCAGVTFDNKTIKNLTVGEYIYIYIIHTYIHYYYYYCIYICISI